MWQWNQTRRWIARGALGAGIVIPVLFMIFPFEKVAVPVAMFLFVAIPAGLMYWLFGE